MVDSQHWAVHKRFVKPASVPKSRLSNPFEYSFQYR